MYRLAIVDDNETWCFVLALRLQQQGYTVSTFTDVQAFLREVTQFDLVLVDFSIPTPRYQRSMDGPELIYQVKHQLNNPPLLILISSFFTQDLLKEATDICPEADAILSKQLETTEILSHIHQLLSDRTPKVQNHRRSKPSISPMRVEQPINA
jgi:CheY-like chemotaxis protein